jgi:hypothetical protein
MTKDREPTDIYEGEADIYAHACDNENCECRNSTLWPDNIRNGCPNASTEEV